MNGWAWMDEQKKRTRITRPGKNCAINCTIQGVRLIWKQKIWLAICEFLWSLTNQNAWFVTSFCTCQSFLISTFCTNFVFLHSKNFKFLHCLGLIALLSANQNREIFSCILLILKLELTTITKISRLDSLWKRGWGEVGNAQLLFSHTVHQWQDLGVAHESLYWGTQSAVPAEISRANNNARLEISEDENSTSHVTRSF